MIEDLKSWQKETRWKNKISLRSNCADNPEQKSFI